MTATVAGLDHGYDRTFILLAGGNLHQVIEQGSRDSASLREKLKAAGIEGEKLRQLTRVIEPLRLAHRYDPRTTWLYSGEYDNVVPPACSQALADAAHLPNSHHIVLPVDHYSGIVLLPKILLQIQQAMLAVSDDSTPKGKEPGSIQSSEQSATDAKRLLIVAPERFHAALAQFLQHWQPTVRSDPPGRIDSEPWPPIQMPVLATAGPQRLRITISERSWTNWFQPEVGTLPASSFSP